MKNEKNVWIASFFNFVIWGLGYFYLGKQVIKGFISFILYCLILFFSIILMVAVGYPLIFPIMFWVAFWSIWCSIFLAYDVYKTSHEIKPTPLKIQRVKIFVRKPKSRTRKK